MGASSQTVAEHGIAGSDEEERAAEREEDKVEHEKLPQLSPVCLVMLPVEHPPRQFLSCRPRWLTRGTGPERQRAFHNPAGRRNAHRAQG